MSDKTETIVITGQGDGQHLDGARIQRASDRFQRDLDYAEKAKTHVWIATVAHQLSDARARQVADGDTSATLLDAETVVVAGMGCYRCEQPLERRLIGKRCPGDPATR